MNWATARTSWGTPEAESRPKMKVPYYRVTKVKVKYVNPVLSLDKVGALCVCWCWCVCVCVCVGVYEPEERPSFT